LIVDKLIYIFRTISELKKQIEDLEAKFKASQDELKVLRQAGIFFFSVTQQEVPIE
jgi:hypothetical protein